MRIVEVRPGDEALLAQWHRVYDEAQRHGRPDACPWQLEEVRVDLSMLSRTRIYRALAGVVDDAVVSIGQIGMPLLDNTRTATVEVGTAVAHRRRGHGSTMLHRLIGIARDHGRDVLFAEVFYPCQAAPDGRGEVGPEFVTRHGFGFALGDLHRVLDLPVAASTLTELAALAQMRHEGYRIEVFTAPVPERWLPSYAALDARVDTEAPTGDLEVEPQTVDPAAFREQERLTAARGRTTCAAVALDRHDRVVAFSAVAVPAAEPGRCYQWGTLVDTPHRGHRLGLAVKVANLRQLQEQYPQLRSMTTINAESNRHMVAINDQLGFRPVERLAEFQLRL